MATPERARAADRISMSDLLASCAAADAVSTPPRERQAEPQAEPEIDEVGEIEQERAVRPEAA
ncbi:hypothetical protein [Streptomyces sp. NPDC006551]|uniref:hypothetical protein n=1 Tax=Streptomyces sp. NPDC006551 TaxID=3157178 RepID=UPI0033BF4CB5